MVLRRTRFELRKAEERAETLEGYLIALANLDEFIRIIRGSANRDEARVKLLAFEFTRKQVEQIGILIRNEARLTDGRYAFSEHQANQILELRLYQLTGLESDKVDNEYKELIETIKDLRDILAKEIRVFEIIKKELREIRQKHAGPRLTQLVPDEGEINMEDLIANEGCIISITHGGFIKRTAVSAFRAQRRGGKGVIGMTTREGATEEDEGDFIEHLFTATTHDYLMFFTDIGPRLRGKGLRDSRDGPRRQRPLDRQPARTARRRKNRRHHPHSIEEQRHRRRTWSTKPGTKIFTSFSRPAPAS